MLEELSNEEIDLIVLPEMALIGYRFNDRADVEPFVESVPADLTPIIEAIDEREESKEDTAMPCTFKWALGVSKKFAPAWVAVGFAERDESDHYFNSAMVVNYNLRECHVVRKVLAYEDDLKWMNVEQAVSGIEYNF